MMSTRPTALSPPSFPCLLSRFSPTAFPSRRPDRLVPCMLRCLLLPEGYVREQLEYCRIWALLSFSEKLEKILPDVGPADVKFQMHFTPDDLKQLLGSTMSGNGLCTCMQRVGRAGDGRAAVESWVILLASLGFAPPALLGNTGAEKKLGMIHGRIAKHFSSQPSKFVQGVWSRCQEALVQCYQRLEGQIRLCYPGIVLSPTTEGLIEMLDAASSR